MASDSYRSRSTAAVIVSDGYHSEKRTKTIT
jgi:hypothetical protein